MRVIIEVAEGPHKGQTFAFEGHDTFLVGRSRRAHFRLPREDRYFSRIHFLVEVNPPSCRLMDMGSKNGTFVNGKRVSLVDLRDGDKIQGGKTVLRMHVEAQEAAPVAVAREAPAKLIAPPPRPGTSGRAKAIPPAEAIPSSEMCPVCAAPMTSVSPPGEWPLCKECRSLARRGGQPIRGYRLIRELGQGENGVTYVAIDDANGKPTAIKFFAPSGEVAARAVERFLREAAALKLLCHPYIVRLREVGEAGGQPFAASEFVRGNDTAQIVAEKGPLPPSEAVELICQLLEALDHAHSEGYVHRALKPTSLRINAGGMVRVVGFGLAGLFRTSDLSGLSLQNRTGRSLPFMAPEQVTSFREARPPADQYSAAAVLYFLLTGKPTHDFSGSMPDCMLMVLQEEPVPLRTRRPELPPMLAQVVHRALAKEPETRFPDVASMLQALTNCGV